MYLFTVAGSMIILLSAQSDAYAHAEEACIVVLMFLLYGLASFALTYVLSLFFQKHFLAQGITTIQYWLP